MSVQFVAQHFFLENWPYKGVFILTEATGAGRASTGETESAVE